MIGKEITVNSDDVRLVGTLCLPSEEASFPCVLMIHGSGPLDRDENAKGLKMNVFNTIAHYLATKDIASLRYDKRGCGKSSGNYWEAGFYDLIQDGKAMYEYLTSQEYINKDLVFLLGHSEGAHIAQRISLEYPIIAGLILIAPTVQKLEQVMVWQAYKGKEVIEQGGGLTNLLIKLLWKLTGDPLKATSVLLQRTRSTNRAWFRYWWQKINAKWLRELLDYDPVNITRNVRCPILAITGEKDMQVDPKDVIQIAELATSEVEYHIVPNLTHILRLDEQTPSIFRYKKLVKRDIDHTILDTMHDWLQKRL